MATPPNTAAAASGVGPDTLIPVEPAPKRATDVASEERDTERRLLAHGAAYRHRNKKAEEWPSFHQAAAQLPTPPRMKQFRDPEGQAVADMAELPPDLMKKVTKVARATKGGLDKSPVSPPPSRTRSALDVTLDDLTGKLPGVGGAGAGAGQGAAAGAGAGGGSFNEFGMRAGWSTGQKVALLGTTVFLMYASVTKLRPLWGGRQSSAATAALLGPRSGSLVEEAAPVIGRRAHKYPPNLGSSKWAQHGAAQGTGDGGLNSQVDAEAAAFGFEYHDSGAAAAEAATETTNPEIQAVEQRLAELRKRVADAKVPPRPRADDKGDA